jgi:hypothetical protein
MHERNSHSHLRPLPVDAGDINLTPYEAGTLLHSQQSKCRLSKFVLVFDTSPVIGDRQYELARCLFHHYLGLRSLCVAKDIR